MLDGKYPPPPFWDLKLSTCSATFYFSPLSLFPYVLSFSPFSFVKSTLLVPFLWAIQHLQYRILHLDEAVKFTSEMHDPCAQTVTYKREENTNTLQKAPVLSRPNTLQRSSQKSSYNSRVLESGQLHVPWCEEDVGAFIVVRSCLLSL